MPNSVLAEETSGFEGVAEMEDTVSALRSVQEIAGAVETTLNIDV